VEQWEKDLREEIGIIMNNNKVNSNKKVSKKKRIKSILLILFLVILVANFFLLEYKHPGCTFNKIIEIKNGFSSKENNQHQNLEKMFKDVCVRISDLEKKSSNEDLKKEIQMLRDRLLLIAIVSDENAAISRKLIGKYDYEAEQFIHIDPDWKIDRMPNHIEIAPEADEFLRERLSN